MIVLRRSFLASVAAIASLGCFAGSGGTGMASAQWRPADATGVPEGALGQGSSEPVILDRAAQPYAAIGKQLALPEIGRSANESIPELFSWLGRHGIAPAGAPFLKYDVVNMERQLEVEWGVPTATQIQGDGRVPPGVLPAGRYASLVHRGSYDGLAGANARLLKWVADKDIALDMTKTPAGDKFGCRLEIYLTDPRLESNPEKFETEVAVRLADGPTLRKT